MSTMTTWCTTRCGAIEFGSIPSFFKIEEPMSRLETIRKIVAQSPNDPFPLYGLAMELRSSGQVQEAIKAFGELEGRFPGYVAQYLMHGNLLVEMGRKDAAAEVLRRGLEVVGRSGDAHARGELEQALDAL
jgi:tetratricopeptide (TPR) repeat protein